MAMSRRPLFPNLPVCLALGLLVFGLACDSASPVAPTGTLLTISASPNEITANGSSTIRVTALRANGTPVNPGTIVRLDTTLGTITDQVEIDDQGTATANLRGDGRIGTATVTARSGSAEAAMVEVAVGKAASTVSLQATPSSIPETGGRVTLLAVVRDDKGQPLPGATVNFTTTIGQLASGGSLMTTNANGQATDQLIVDENDIDALPSTTNDFQVGVEVGGAGNLVTADFTIRLESPILEADFTFNANKLTVQFTDLTTGDPSSFRWTFGDGSVSTEQNPSHTYAAAGTYSVTLKVTRGRSESQITKSVTVSQ